MSYLLGAPLLDLGCGVNAMKWSSVVDQDRDRAGSATFCWIRTGIGVHAMPIRIGICIFYFYLSNFNMLFKILNIKAPIEKGKKWETVVNWHYCELMYRYTCVKTGKDSHVDRHRFAPIQSGSGSASKWIFGSGSGSASNRCRSTTINKIYTGVCF